MFSRGELGFRSIKRTPFIGLRADRPAERTEEVRISICSEHFNPRHRRVPAFVFGFKIWSGEPTRCVLPRHLGHIFGLQVLLLRIACSTPAKLPPSPFIHCQAVVAELLGAGANVNLVNTLGTTPLHSACAHLQPHCVELLLARGCVRSRREHLFRTSTLLSLPRSLCHSSHLNRGSPTLGGGKAGNLTPRGFRHTLSPSWR